MATPTNSYLNVVTFLLSTLFYYMAIKPSITMTTLTDAEQERHYLQKKYIGLAIYIALVIVVQFMVNASVITNMCGGSMQDNIGTAGIMTFLPWILLFGVLLVVLSIYPGLTAVFADVVGYYWVSSSANRILTELMMQREVETVTANMSAEQRQSVESAADLILKISGNASVLINQIVPSNFLNFWDKLKPLFKPKYQAESTETNTLKKQLFDLVVTRTDVGEAMWYIYTGVLLTSVVQLNLVNRGCRSNPKVMEDNYQAFLKQEQAQQTSQSATASTYTSH